MNSAEVEGGRGRSQVLWEPWMPGMDGLLGDEARGFEMGVPPLFPVPTTIFRIP
jgi:hypothetical protein